MATQGVRGQRAPVAAAVRAAGPARLRGWQAWWSTWRASVVTAGVAVLAFRLVTLLLAAAVAHGQLLHPWDAFDATWWARIAQHGYGHVESGTFSDGAFAPGYAMAVRAAIAVFPVGALAAGLLVSSLSLLVAATVVHRLIAEDHGGSAALTGVLLMLLWPTAVFLAAPYSEPFSLALVALALLAARRQRWWWAGGLAAAAMLSKYVLGLLVVALVVDHVVRQRRRGAAPRPGAVAALVLPGALALAGVLLWQRVRFGDPLFFLQAEAAAWGHRLATPVTLALNAKRELASAVQLGALPQFRAFFLDDVTILGLAALAATMLARVRLRRHPAEVALVALIAAAFLCMSGPDSVGRYALVVAPVYVVLGPALALRPRVRAAVLAGSAALMVLQLVTFATGGWAG